MKKQQIYLQLTALLILFNVSQISFSQSRGVKTITEKELRYHLEFIGAKEFRGRETPSSELSIATLYIGNWAKNAGLKPILKDGSFYQDVPVTVKTVFQPNTRLRVNRGTGENVYYYGKGFGGNFSASGSYSGSVVFAGLGISDPDHGWDDLKDLDLTGKVVLILDAMRPGSKQELGIPLTGRFNSRVAVLRDRGASVVFSIISNEREGKMVPGVNVFENTPVGRLATLYDSQRTRFTTVPAQSASQASERRPLPFEKAEISQAVAAEILGITRNEIGEMFSMIKQGKEVPSKVVPNVRVNLDVEIELSDSSPRNVIAVVEGSDPILKNEYIVVSGHIDARGMTEGEPIAGADDNGSACVALMEIAKALLTERPKRSVILSWFTGEEQEMNGSQYFINNCPVPVEKISTCLNMDMIGRNTPDSLYLVGSDLLSSGLDASIKKVNRNSGLNFGFDYRYSNLTHPQRVYFRSDHYPFVRFGIPSVWFFCGFTFDYHAPGDIPEHIDYTKLLRVTKLVYLTAFDTGNMTDILKLDVNPAVTLRGKHNLTESSLFQNKAK